VRCSLTAMHVVAVLAQRQRNDFGEVKWGMSEASPPLLLLPETASHADVRGEGFFETMP
jgi:hypothetical protein